MVGNRISKQSILARFAETKVKALCMLVCAMLLD